MIFRKAKETDLNKILNLIVQAQLYFKENGINQWQNGYPNINSITNDIQNDYCYVLEKDNLIVGSVAVIFDIEKTYNEIYEGNWKSNQEYVVIHRLVVESNHKGKGLASEILRNIEELSLQREIHSIKVDTHKDNTSMQKLLYKNGFEYCGIIYLEDNYQRIAFEKIILDSTTQEK